MTPLPQERHAMDLTLTERELASRLSWFIAIRWFAGAATFILLQVARNVFGIRFDDPGPVLAAIVVLLLYNAGIAVAVKALRSRGALSRKSIHLLAHVQVVCDLLLLAVIWHFTGAVENAFGIFFIFPMVWASELLSRRNAYLYAVLGAVLLNAVAWGEFAGVLPHEHLVRETAAGGPAHEFIRDVVYRDWHRVFMVTFSLSIALFVTVFLAATVSDRLRMRENQLAEAYRSCKSLDILKSQFMRKASHELRAPLAATHTLLRTVLAGLTGKVDPRQVDMIQRACERTDSLMDLINDLLRYSRLEAEAGTRVPRRPVQFADVVRRTVELLSPSAEAGGVRLDTQIRPAVVLADDEGLTELATNLVSNAIRYSPGGGAVDVRLDTLAGRAVFRVQDHGIGIAPEDLPFVFDEFFRSEAAKEAVQHGTGMGLAIVKRLVDSYDGSIDVASEPARGTTFTVRLPLAPPESA